MDIFEKCLESIPQVDSIVVINDGQEYPGEIYKSKPNEIIQHKTNIGVGKSKNDALKFLIQQKCSYIFLCEDDILIRNQNVCSAYINLSEKSGLMHMNYAYHGPANKGFDGSPNPRKIIDGMSLNKHLTGAFSFYTDEIIRRIGFIDERFKNAYEHVDHTYQIIKAGYHPPFWWFADMENSYEFIADLYDINKTSIIRRNVLKWKLNLKLNALKFKYKNGCIPDHIPDSSFEEVIKSLDNIRTEKK
jgi:GT2 family glycosyltransferase